LSDGEREQLAPLMRKGSCPARRLVSTASGARCRAIGDAWNARSLKGEPIIRLILGGTIVRVLYVGGYDPSKLPMSKAVLPPTRIGIHNLVKDTESDGWPTMAEAKDFAENILDELESPDAA
jgi:hypothetical protein